MERYASAPGFVEYLEARGVDLLRTGWLLTGSEDGARRLVAATLARAWPRWRHLAEVGAGSYDAELRRELVGLYLQRRGEARPRRDAGGGGREAAGRSPSLDADARRDAGARAPQGHRAPQGPRAPEGARSTPSLHGDRQVLDALLRLSRADRARVVLSLFDGLGDGRLAAAFDEPVPTARRRRDAAVRSLVVATGRDEQALVAALDRLAPAAPALDGLARAPVARGPSRARRLTGWAGAAVVLVGAAALAVSVAVPHLGPPAPSVPRPPAPSVPRPSTTALGSSDCVRRQDAPAVPPVSGLGTPGNPVVGIVVCARTDEDSVWTGYLPPSQPVTDARALAMVVLARRDAGSGCGQVPQGPAFRVLVESSDGHVATYANEGLRCNGWPALDSFYRAEAEQDTVRAQPRWDDGFLTCPPVFDPQPVVGAATPVQRGTRFDLATLCLHPLPVGGRVPRMRPVTRLVLAQSQVAQLDAELATHGSTRAPRPPCRGTNGLFVLRARTTTGRVLDLAGACPDQLGVDFDRREWLRLGPASAAMVSTGLDVSYR
ncbi:hypothetical protein GCM10027517_36280 [Phycicoccus ginsengisoli]